MLLGKIRRIIFNVVGFCLVLLGLLIGLTSEHIFNKLMEEEMVLRPNSTIFELWKTPPLKISLDFYMFNWTNPEDFQNLDKKPKFEELGPYRFTEVPNKIDIKWHPDNASMSYKKQSKYYFDAEGSKGRLEDEIVTINSLAVSLSAKAKGGNKLRRRMIDFALIAYGNDMTVKKSVDELLFSGYKDVLLTFAKSLPFPVLDVEVPFDKFGYCYPRNNSADLTGTYNIHTGADDIKKFGQIHTWNYRDSTPVYSPECAKVYGSPGEFQSLYLQPEKPIDFFLSDICRTVTMDYVQAAEVEGIKGFRYEGGKRMVDNGTLYPENICHCNGQCVPSGLINISSCWYGSPMFLSYPHFHDADPYYLSEVDGLKPDKQKHELYLVLDQKTGLMLEMVARLQSNILVEPISDFTMFRNKRRLFFPLFWFEARTRISSELANEFRLVPQLIFWSRVFGGFSALLGVILMAWHPIKTSWQQSLVQRIEINNLHIETFTVAGKTKSLQPDISSLLVAAVQANAKILQRGDTTLSDLSLGESMSSAEGSSMQST